MEFCGHGGGPAKITKGTLRTVTFGPQEDSGDALLRIATPNQGFIAPEKSPCHIAKGSWNMPGSGNQAEAVVSPREGNRGGSAFRAVVPRPPHPESAATFPATPGEHVREIETPGAGLRKVVL